MPRESVPPEVKAAAIADLRLGEQPAVVAERYKLNAATVRSWKRRIDRLDATDDATLHATHVATPIRPSIIAAQLTLAELVQENLKAKLIATQRIAEHATVPAWLDRQTAADVATLFEVLDRSAIGILDRLAARTAAPPGADGDAGDPDGAD